MNLDVSLETEPRGYAHLVGDDLTLYLATIAEIPIGNGYVPFETIEQVFEELVIHENIHKLSRVCEDNIVDAWHLVYCKGLNNKKVCDCPIDCFWRNNCKRDELVIEVLG